MRELYDLAYVTDGHQRQRLDLFLPGDAADPAHPLIVWIHGGGWEGGDKGNSPAREFVPRGYAVASLNYRFSREAVFPAQIEDCKAAIRWLRAHASQYGLDANRIGIWGSSAGGHLSAMLGVTGTTREFDTGENLAQSSRVQCVVDWFGPTDFLHYGNYPAMARDTPESALTRLIGGKSPEKARRASPYYFVSAAASPFLIMHGDKDNLVPLQQSEVLDQALRAAGVESKLMVLPGSGHGGPAFSAPEAHRILVEFLDRHLAHPRLQAHP